MYPDACTEFSTYDIKLVIKHHKTIIKLVKMSVCNNTFQNTSHIKGIFKTN